MRREVGLARLTVSDPSRGVRRLVGRGIRDCLLVLVLSLLEVNMLESKSLKDLLLESSILLSCSILTY